MTQNANNLVWVDMEMTGLDPDTDKVLEIATIITDAQLNILAEGPVLAIHQPDDVLDNMNEWCVKVHGETGLTQRCRDSQISEQQAAQATLEFLKQWVPEGKAPLCGNSIGQDRRFMVGHMPELEAYFHYRNVDVSTVKELVKRWKPEVLDGFKKKGVHLALDDIRESIAEMAYYREHVFSI
ncbi:Oligoribonuclease [Saliniradius amylolyticus]|uniref:Oligoribonuclease n=1 Tax=Saliniradius amylolyticus TaxID=2183582 RepID=A0A2S2E6G2_9ALTE|nr:oligoribonuclease [Saliniradius amylolyticus]AWL13231.1 Oligoribonuclease [Saliniradius amylolyticus]